MKKALICGRGKSLEYYKRLENEDYDYVYLVNDFNVFVRQQPYLLKFLQDKSKKAKIIQQVNICITGVDHFLLQNLPISECFVARCPHIKNSDHWVDDWADTSKLIRMGIPCLVKPHPSTLRQYAIDLEISNSLPFAILNAIVDKECKKIDVIGKDFYENEYAFGTTESDYGETSALAVQDRLKKGIDRVCNEFLDVNFNFFTCSTYKSKTKNCEVVYL